LLGYMTNLCTSLHWIHCTRVSTLKIQPKGKTQSWRFTKKVWISRLYLVGAEATTSKSCSTIM
jgi:hypothetical protein